MGAYERPAADSDAWGFDQLRAGQKANREALVRAISRSAPKDGKTPAPKGYDPRPPHSRSGSGGTTQQP